MRQRTLGRTGLEVSELGFGAWEIGWTALQEGDEIGRLLNRALDAGINFIDSSAAYRWSEELISKYVGHRRHEFIFATKCGSGRVLQPDGEWVQRTRDTGLPILVCNRSGGEGDDLDYSMAESVVAHGGETLLVATSKRSVVLSFDWDMDKMRLLSSEFSRAFI